MRLRHIPGSEEAVAQSPYVISGPESYRGRMNELFGNDSPVRIEIGCGKGRFITELAHRDPLADYIGIERYSSVLLHALKKIGDSDAGNLLFLCEDASELEKFFVPGEIDRIYLNFPDPWPKDRHAHRRLTSPGFLAIYRNILKEGGHLEFKTDNEALFDYSLSTLRECGWEIPASTRDLYADDLSEENIATEYEIKFSSRGNPIFRLIAEPDD